MSEQCAFCNEEVIKGEFFCGESSQHTMKQMIQQLTGAFGFARREEEDNHLVDGIKLTDGNMLCFDNSSREYDPLCVRIHYCPMCGKKLKEECEERE